MTAPRDVNFYFSILHILMHIHIYTHKFIHIYTHTLFYWKKIYFTEADRQKT